MKAKLNQQSILYFASFRVIRTIKINVAIQYIKIDITLIILENVLSSQLNTISENRVYKVITDMHNCQ